MNMKAILVTGWVVGAMLLFTNPALAQSGGDYDLSWSTIDGGGGKSIGGSYTLSGTIGQPDAGEMTGGSYLLLGGFWFRPICIVGLDDLSYFSDYWLMTGSGLPADFLGSDNEVNLIDYSYLASYWMDYCPSSWPW